MVYKFWRSSFVHLFHILKEAICVEMWEIRDQTHGFRWVDGPNGYFQPRIRMPLSTLSKKLGFVKLFSLRNLRRKPNLNMEIVRLTWRPLNSPLSFYTFVHFSNQWCVCKIKVLQGFDELEVKVSFLFSEEGTPFCFSESAAYML